MTHDREHKVPVITMTFAGEEISFRAAGSGEAVVDWGDGGRETLTLKRGSFFDIEDRSAFELKHVYKEREKAARVTIEGNVAAFDCSGGHVTVLDVTGNPALKWLNCSGNGITALDIKSSPALEWLNCSGNDITSLDLFSNSALKGLNCGNSGITALDVGDNPALYSLDCSNTNMNAAAADALFRSLPAGDDVKYFVEIYCGGTTACGEEAHALAREKNWEVRHL